MVITRRDFFKTLALTLVESVERFAVISDTHQFFNPQSSSLLNALKQRPVDFILVAGDVCEVMCGPDWLFNCVGGNLESGWQWTRTQLNTLGKEWLAIPGNHDLVTGSLFGPPDLQAVNLWDKYIGPLEFVKETDYCKIVGINYLNWNYGWLDSQLATDKHKIVMSHLPLFGVQPHLRDQRAEKKISYLISQGVSWLVCGHTHQFSMAQIGPLTQVVCPSVAYTLQPDMPHPVEDGLFPVGIPTLGWMEIEASITELKIELWRGDGMRLLEFPVNCLFFPVIK